MWPPVARLGALFQQHVLHPCDRAEQWRHIWTARIVIRQCLALTSAAGLIVSLAIGDSFFTSERAIAEAQTRAPPRPSLPFVVNGRAHRCSDFFLEFLFFFTLGRAGNEPGWVLVQRSDPVELLGQDLIELLGRDVRLPKFRSASGVVTRSFVNFEDFPDLHDSHDFTFDLRLDRRLLGVLGTSDLPILSDSGKDRDQDGIPDTLHLEWETGILPTQVVGDGSARFFPKWAWPSVGDRVWANGYWIFDCGHPAPPGRSWRLGVSMETEIHPIRAIASMRQQVATPPGSTVPIPVTATDLYIHGRAGVATDVLECGQEVILDDRTCPTRSEQLAKGWTRSDQTPKGCDTKQLSPGCNPETDRNCYPCHDPVGDHLGIPIDENFEFDICMPPKPDPAAVPRTWVSLGPDNTVSDQTRAPIIEVVNVGDPSLDPCASIEFGPEKVHVTIPLAGSGVTPDDVYARTIYAGWVGTPLPLRQFLVRLDSMHLINDQDGGDEDGCECTFFWMNVDHAPNEWIRLSDFAIGTRFDPIPMQSFRAGERITFTSTVATDASGRIVSRSGANFAFFVPDGQSFTIRANGYDGGYGEGSRDPGQDCFDEHFGHHDFAAHVAVDLTRFFDTCYAMAKLRGEGVPTNDPFQELRATFGPHNGYGVGSQTLRPEPSCVARVQQRPRFSPFGAQPPRQSIFQLPIPCDPEQQQAALQAFEQGGFIVLRVDTNYDYELVVTIREIPVTPPPPPPPPPPGPNLAVDNVGCNDSRRELEFRISNIGDGDINGFSTRVVFTFFNPETEEQETEVRVGKVSFLEEDLSTNDSVDVPPECYEEDIPIELRGCDVSVEVVFPEDVDKTDNSNESTSCGK